MWLSLRNNTNFRVSIKVIVHEIIIILLDIIVYGSSDKNTDVYVPDINIKIDIWSISRTKYSARSFFHIVVWYVELIPKRISWDTK